MFDVLFGSSGRSSESRAPCLPHVPLLHLRPHAQERWLLPAAVELQVHNMVVDGPQPPHRHLRIPAACVPQKPLRHQDLHWGGEAPMLTDSTPTPLQMLVKSQVHDVQVHPRRLLICVAFDWKPWNKCSSDLSGCASFILCSSIEEDVIISVLLTEKCGVIGRCEHKLLSMRLSPFDRGSVSLNYFGCQFLL